MNTVYTQPDMVGMPTCRIEFEAIDGDVLIFDCRASNWEDAVEQAQVEFDQELDVLCVMTIH